MTAEMKDYVKFLRALASEERIAILEELEQVGKINASEVEKKFYMEQSTASHHLSILKQAKILESRKEGRFVYYHLREDRLTSFYNEFISELKKKQLQKMQNKLIN